MNNKKNIALFAPSIGFGGTERVVCRLANALVVHHNVFLVLLHNSIDLPIHEEITIITISNKPEHFKASKFAKTVDFLKGIYTYPKIIKKHQISVSISFLIRQNIVNVITKMLNPKLKTVLSERCFPSNTYGSLGTYAIRYFYNKSDCLFSNSVHINTDLQNNFNLKIPAHVIYNPIETLVVKPNFTSFNKNIEPFKLVSVGRLNPVKNQKCLIQSMALLQEDTLLNIFGIGILENELKTLTNTLNLNSQINFKGNSDTIQNEIIKHHCLILTSLSEGFPNVILEAMSLGVPVIATNCNSGPLELLNDNEEITIAQNDFYKAKYGLLVNIEDSKGLAKAINYYRDNEEVRINYSKLSFNKAKQFDTSKIALQVNELIHNLCVE